MDDLIAEFLTETNESLEALDTQLVDLEQDPNNPELISSIFRLVHTIKGTCGFIGLARLEKLAHAGENVLGKFRDKALEVTPPAVTLILRCIDQIKEIVGAIAATGSEPDGDDTEMIAELNAAAEGKFAVDAAAPPAAIMSAPPTDDFAAIAAALMAEDAAILAQFGGVATSKSDKAPETPPVLATPLSSGPVKPAAGKEKQSGEGDAKAGAATAETQTIRVNVQLLEDLMTTVSELVLTRNQLLQILRLQKESDFTSPLQRLNHVVSELQENVMKTRMQPIGNAWSKLPRLIRDLSHELNKKIELEMIGADTELDRQVSEIIRDPLTHMVRNSGDHGLETPAERLAAGKSETGHIKLEAFHEGGHIIIKISDDGRGINTDKVKAKAIANGLATESEIANMSDQQILQFIFRAGFSTAEKITSVSGRGVGMDVVRTNIEKIGGTVELQSVMGKGSVFTIKIPLTLAIVSSLILGVNGERFALPQISVVELVATDSRSKTYIEYIHGTPVFRLRNRLLPLISLREILKLENKTEQQEQVIVVSHAGNQTFGIVVDEVYDQEEIVVKPVSSILRQIEIFSGNTILGDGSVVMILDPNGIATQLGDPVHDQESTASTEKKSHTADDTVAFLLFYAGQGAPKAVPLNLVARLENIAANQIERSDDNYVTQYRGKLMPLIAMPGVGFDQQIEGSKPVMVFADGERSMGLVVDQIMDILDDRLDIQLSTEQPGLIGTGIINGKSTDIIDVPHYLTQAFHDWFGDRNHEHATQFKALKNKRILLVDDSPFFRNMLTPLLSVAGYEVITLSSAEEALSLCQEGHIFDAIVSDIEMPGMNGYELAESLRNNARLQHIPLIALSGHTGEKDRRRGREAGFDDYVPKYDRDALLRILAKILLAQEELAVS